MGPLCSASGKSGLLMFVDVVRDIGMILVMCGVVGSIAVVDVRGDDLCVVKIATC